MMKQAREIQEQRNILGDVSAEITLTQINHFNRFDNFGNMTAFRDVCRCSGTENALRKRRIRATGQNNKDGLVQPPYMT